MQVEEIQGVLDAHEFKADENVARSTPTNLKLKKKSLAQRHTPAIQLVDR
ncbi:MAG: hypothetical protein ACXW06_06605 [Halobacteriota archaeon]